MPYDMTSCLWPDKDEYFFRDKQIRPVQQKGPHCVSTALAMLTGKSPKDFQGSINTQDPVSWSKNLQTEGMKLAYCPTDARKLKHYMNELVILDDLFIISYYTTLCHERILGEPDETGWITGSHIVVLHRDRIYDPMLGTASLATVHTCNEYFTKRIFRVVPVGHERGI